MKNQAANELIEVLFNTIAVLRLPRKTKLAGMAFWTQWCNGAASIDRQASNSRFKAFENIFNTSCLTHNIFFDLHVGGLYV